MLATIDRAASGAWRTGLIVATVAIALRLGVQTTLGFYDHPETWEEGVVALDVAAGRGYGFMQFGTWQMGFRAPLYALVLGGAYAVLGTGPLVAGALNALLGGATAACAAMLARHLAGPAAGLIAGFLVASHPGLVVYSAKVHQLSLDAFLMIAAALLAVFALRDPRIPVGVALGSVGAVLALSRPTALPYVGLAVVVVMLRHRGHALRWAALATLIVLAVSGGWVARTWAATGEATLSTSTGLLLWTGHNPHATGSAAAADGRSMWDTDPEISARVFGRPEAEQDRIFREAALEHIFQDPLRTARDVVQRFARFWWFGPMVGFFYPAAWLYAYAAYWVVAAVLALAGALVLARRGATIELLLVAALPLVVAASQALFYVEGRHRWAVEPVIVVLTAIGATAAVAATWRSSAPSAEAP